MASGNSTKACRRLPFSVRKLRSSSKILRDEFETSKSSQENSPLKRITDYENSLDYSPSKRLCDGILSPSKSQNQETSRRIPQSARNLFADGVQSKSPSPEKTIKSKQTNIIYPETKATLNSTPNLKWHCQDNEISSISSKILSGESKTRKSKKKISPLKRIVLLDCDDSLAGSPGKRLCDGILSPSKSKNQETPVSISRKPSGVSTKACRRLPFSVRKLRNSSKILNDESETSKSSQENSPIKSTALSEFENSPVGYSDKQSRVCDGILSPSKSQNQETPVRISLSPRKLFADSDQNKTPTTNNHFKQTISIYQETKLALSPTSNLKLHCRDNEISTITKFLNEHLDSNKPGCIYISGPPGTGKTACIDHALESCDRKCKKAIVNCANLNDPSKVYEEIWKQLAAANIRKSPTDFSKAMERQITTSKNPILIILDEIDYLENKDQKVLYTIFFWTTLKDSKLVLIGLANALDLTARVLPRLQIYKCNPELLHFQPYSKEQISTIINERLKLVKSDNPQIIKSMAIEFCARKVASVTGDMRKALDVCRRAVELVEAEMYHLRAVKSCGSDSENSATIKIVELPTVVSILNDVYGNSLANREQSDENSLPLQQRILLCTLLLLIKHTKTKEITLGKFSDVYSRVCVLHQACKMDQGEFVNICHLLEARGLLNIKYNKEIRQSKVNLRVNEAEIEFALQDKILLSSILNNSARILQRKTTILDYM
ncbi:AAA ATPase [Chamberlinius hualienensis]